MPVKEGLNNTYMNVKKSINEIIEDVDDLQNLSPILSNYSPRLKNLSTNISTSLSTNLSTSPSTNLSTNLSTSLSTSGWVRPVKIPEKQWYCHNCGKEGHQNSGCDSPITSYGIILFYHSSDRSIIEENIEIQEWFMNREDYDNEFSLSQDDDNFASTHKENAIIETPINKTVGHESGNVRNIKSVQSVQSVQSVDVDELVISHQNDVQYLLILDRHTPDYAQIIIGNYEINNIESIDYLRRLLARITETEANLILKHNFRDLFLNYWSYAKKDPTKVYNKQFDKANELFTKLMKGIIYKKNKDYDKIRKDDKDDKEFITWKSLIYETSPHWFDPDWGFPKGRRRRKSSEREHEPDLECAMRELVEETGVTPDQYRIMDEIEPIQEDIKGSNGLNYRNIYYLAEARFFIPVFVNPNNIQQSSEVSKIGWYNYEQSMKLIRPYHTHRLNIIYRVHKYLSSLSPYLEGGHFHPGVPSKQ